MNSIVLFPHQLFAEVLERCVGIHIYLVEHPLYFTQFRFHAQKLVLHRASMRAFAEALAAAHAHVTYCDIDTFPTLDDVATRMKADGVTSILHYEVVDDWLDRDVQRCLAPLGPVSTLPTPMFLTSEAQLREYFGDRTLYRMAPFYAMQRRRLGILVDDQGRPTGGKWSFDTENRKRLPVSLTVPPPRTFDRNAYVSAAEAWVALRFPDAYGSVSGFDYPTTHEQAHKALDDFLIHRFALFGDYEDAMRTDDSLLFHSRLTPALNIGLITPAEVVATTLRFANAHATPINAVEGFIRQIIGWREFIRGVYAFAGRTQRTRNAFAFTRPMPEAFWNGSTGLLPADTVIQRLIGTAYCHHIERLMVLGNLMLLCEIDPDRVYDWFMTLFIDAYDWVMVPNVYGMSQFADDGLMSTKPYVCGSPYLRRMGDWKPGAWTKVWDGLYWRFVDRHRERFEKNQRLGFAPQSFDKLPPARREVLLSTAAHFLEELQ